MLNAIAKPFGWLMMRLYEFTGNYGLAIILFALIVKLILLPFQLKSKRGMMQQQRLAPQIKELQKKHAGNQQKLNEETQKLYKEEGVNPMSGCLWSFIPFPILIALYQAIRFPITSMMGIAEAVIKEGGIIYAFLEKTGFESTINNAYGQIAQSQWISNRFAEFQTFVAENSGKYISDGIEKFKAIDYSFIGIDLGARPGIKWLFSSESWQDSKFWLPMLGLFLIPIIAGVLTFLSTKVASAATKAAGVEEDQTQKSMSMMNYFMPLMTIYFAFIVPGSLGIYWIASSAFGIIQDLILNRYFGRKFALEDAEFKARMAAREKKYEEKRKETERLKAMNADERNENTSARKNRVAEREAQREKQKAYEKKKNNESTDAPASQVGNRKYARGRAYDPNRYADNGVSAPETVEVEDVPVLEEAPVEMPEVIEETAEEIDAEFDVNDVAEDKEEDIDD